MKKGFTTIEVLITIGVLALLSSILITYSRTGEKQIILFKEGAVISEIISRAKTLSLSLYGKSGEIPCGYGVYFEDSGKFILFKDLASDCNSSDKKYSGENEIVESFQLNSAIEFKSLGLSDILFIPPDPKVFITPQKDEADIILKILKGEDSIKIKVTDAGQISTEKNQ
ncbi:prepilin-type N-terminal cleavage/methylation domain-containing protein [Candidatus Wolfebacteria bacterium]|nr:prepilin-type N-terminal cleavage/methylation domain-containing protein [Candidatus Wolfebacteria bacterium]